MSEVEDKEFTKSGKTPTICLIASSLCLIALVLLHHLPIFSKGLHVSRYTANFGTVYEGAEIKKHFDVTNLHPWNVQINSVAGDCGCTQPIVRRQLPVTLKPFETVTVNFMLDTAGKFGDVEQRVMVTTENSIDDMQVSVKGRVVADNARKVYE